MGSMSVIPVIRRLGFEEHDLEDSLGYIMRCYFKNKKKGRHIWLPSHTTFFRDVFLKNKTRKKPLNRAGQTVTV